MVIVLQRRFDMKEISERIKLIRKCTRSTEKEFAAKIGISVDILFQWENDTLSPSLEELLKISHTFNISTDFILNGKANSTDDILLNRKLSKEDLLQEIKLCLLNNLESPQSKKAIDKIVEIAMLKDKVSIQNIDLNNKIIFNVKDIINLGDFAIYSDIQKSFEIKGKITFDLLSPHKHSLNFYGEALKNNSEQLEDTFLEYTSNKELWNDEVILWLINNGAVCIEFTSIEGTTDTRYSIDGCSDTNTTYKPVYEENLILTFLLKSELERKLHK